MVPFVDPGPGQPHPPPPPLPLPTGPAVVGHVNNGEVRRGADDIIRDPYYVQCYHYTSKYTVPTRQRTTSHSIDHLNAGPNPDTTSRRPPPATPLPARAVIVPNLDFVSFPHLTHRRLPGSCLRG